MIFQSWKQSVVLVAELTVLVLRGYLFYAVSLLRGCLASQGDHRQ